MNPARELITDAFRAGLVAVQPDTAVRRAISEIDTRDRTTYRVTLEDAPRIDVIAVGKAAVPMMSGAIDALGGAIQRGFVITKDGHVDRKLPDRVEVHEAAHPVLDERSVVATHRLLDWVREIPAQVPVLCLVSGGGSALLEEPVDGVSLEDFQTLTRQLLLAGADIYQLNAVRSAVSKVKGGGLRAAIPAELVISLLLSDVLGNDPAVIASGPTVPIGTTRRDAMKTISELQLTNELPGSISRSLAMNEEPTVRSGRGDIVVVIADNETALNAAAHRLTVRNCHVRLDTQPRTGEARDVARAWVDHLCTLPPEVGAVLAGGELTVTVTGSGTGGRNTEFALAAALELDKIGLTEWTVASLATDGQDGTTDVAGAIVNSATPEQLRIAGVDPVAALIENDSFPGLRQIGAVVDTGPTGTNVNDLYFAVRVSAD